MAEDVKKLRLVVLRGTARVKNTPGEIRQAMLDYESGKMGHLS